jgi:hypothetical protein
LENLLDYSRKWGIYEKIKEYADTLDDYLLEADGHVCGDYDNANEDDEYYRVFGCDS